MNTFVCKRLRLCRYLIERGFMPYQTIPDSNNLRYSVFLFQETPELLSTLTRFYAEDCFTARNNKKGIDDNEKSE